LTKEVETLIRSLEILKLSLDDTQITANRESAKGIADKAEAAEASAAFLSGMEMPDLGSAVWKQLWEAARTYSRSSAYPDHTFPHVDDGARCVLCQQSLGQEAKDRKSTRLNSSHVKISYAVFCL